MKVKLIEIVQFLCCLPLRKLYEQDQILNEAGLKTEAFDKEVEDLSNLKIRVAVEAKFLELHLLTLQQELIILRDFEDVEDKVTNKVLNSLKEKDELERMVCLILVFRFPLHVFNVQLQLLGFIMSHVEALVSAYSTVSVFNLKMMTAMCTET
jgi:hypothetical protein